MNSVCDAHDTAQALFAALNAHDVRAVLELLDPNAAVEIMPAPKEGRAFFEKLLRAFPDLLIQVDSIMSTAELAVVGLKLEGTQACDFLGILNQEKHLDLDQAWMVWAQRGRIARVRAYWCQNQLYRRLAVKRLDRISILGDA